MSEDGLMYQLRLLNFCRKVFSFHAKNAAARCEDIQLSSRLELFSASDIIYNPLVKDNSCRRLPFRSSF